MVNFNELPYNEDILNSFIVTASKLNNPQYKRIMCSISGGSDSDILLDLLTRLDQDKKVQYVWFDTGLEYQATKDHLKYLEQKYGIEIAILLEKEIDRENKKIDVYVNTGYNEIINELNSNYCNQKVDI